MTSNTPTEREHLKWNVRKFENHMVWYCFVSENLLNKLVGYISEYQNRMASNVECDIFMFKLRLVKL